MTVKELIELLEQCQSDADVIFITNFGDKEKVKAVDEDGDTVYIAENYGGL